MRRKSSTLKLCLHLEYATTRVHLSEWGCYIKMVPTWKYKVLGSILIIISMVTVAVVTWKKPGGIGPPGMPSFGGIWPKAGLGAAALCRRERKKENRKRKCKNIVFIIANTRPRKTHWNARTQITAMVIGNKFQDIKNNNYQCTTQITSKWASIHMKLACLTNISIQTEKII